MVSSVFDGHDREVWLALAEALVPAGKHVPPPDEAALAAAEAFLRPLGALRVDAYRAALHLLDRWPGLGLGPPLHARPLEERTRALAALNASPLAFWVVRTVAAPMRAVQADRMETRNAVGAPRLAPPRRERPAGFEAQILDARETELDELPEVDALVVGTGAGGGPVALGLAAQGHAVLILEEGGYFTRGDFTGQPFEMQRRLYRDGGFTVAWGPSLIAIPFGVGVGGTTLINSGTCYRTPEPVLARWRDEQGLEELAPGRLDRYFERVEARLGVAAAAGPPLGGCAEVIARGAEALGFAHGPLARNAPGCDGQGVCCFGCPTGAKRSTDIAYVPDALRAGATLLTHARVLRVVTEGGRARGVVVRVRAADGREREATLRARVIVLACGTVQTPAVLARSGLGGRSGELGRNLTIHPACYSWAEFEHDVRGFAAIPQGYGVDEFVDEGIRFEGAFLPIDLAASLFGEVGTEWTRLVESFHRLACFGFMLTDTARGTVTLGPTGEPAIRYALTRRDLERMARAHAILARIYLAAGARAVYPAMRLFGSLRDERDVERLEREGPLRLEPHHIDVSAYHPLGTCRMAADPARAVVGVNHELHDVDDLFVCDGSVVSGPLGVNPQITIMALGERAAEVVGRRIERKERRAARAAHAARAPDLAAFPSSGVRATFRERMAGELRWGGSARACTLLVDAELAEGPDDRGRTEWTLTGTVELTGECARTPCAGSLTLEPLRPSAMIRYALDFEDDHGEARRLVGTKRLRVTRPVRSFTWLDARVTDGEGVELGRGVLRFDLGDLWRWLGTWELGRGAGRSSRA